jgi:hypothetical protein
VSSGAAGVIDIQLDHSPAPLGYRVEARLWMSVRPSELAATAGTLAGHPEVAFVAVTTLPPQSYYRPARSTPLG